MARVDTGNNLTSVLQQPGARFQEDGYGLATGTIVFKAAITASIGGTIDRGSACPQGAYSYCKAHKYSVSFENLGIATYSVDYVGINPGFGTSTNPQITGSQGLTSEAITTHPNFFETYAAGGFSGSPIAGVGTGSLATPAYPAVTGQSEEFAGNNGATFDKPIGRKFLGFKKPEFKDFYGKTNYLAPQCSLSGVFYTSSSALVINLRNAVGKTSGNGSFASKDLVPTYMGTAFTIGGKNQLLLAQVSFEDFGLLYKIQYELRFNREGYVASVYAPA
jgi:hypothetical protein